MECLHFVQLNYSNIFQQLQLEEALLRADQRNWCLIGQGSTPSIVTGISGKLNELICKKRWEANPIPIIRRFSGGGTVVVDEHTFFVTFICNTSFAPIPPYPIPIMQWTAELYRPLFPSSFALKENDYTIDSYKFGGNAQSICKNRWLHHSSLLWDFNPSYMDYLLHPLKIPDYRQHRTHAEFLYPLRHKWPEKKDFKETLVQHFKKLFTVQEVHPSEVESVLASPHRKATMYVDGF